MIPPPPPTHPSLFLQLHLLAKISQILSCKDDDISALQLEAESLRARNESLASQADHLAHGLGIENKRRQAIERALRETEQDLSQARTVIDQMEEWREDLQVKDNQRDQKMTAQRERNRRLRAELAEKEARLQERDAAFYEAVSNYKKDVLQLRDIYEQSLSDCEASLSVSRAEAREARNRATVLEGIVAHLKKKLQQQHAGNVPSKVKEPRRILPWK